MNEYDEQARKFLRTNNLKLRITEAPIQRPAPWGDGASGLMYEVALSGERGAYHFNFWGSVADRQAHRKPTAYDVLSGLDTWEGTIDDFVSDFGYEKMPVSKVLDTYNAVIDQTLQLKHILPTKALKELEEIN